MPRPIRKSGGGRLHIFVITFIEGSGQASGRKGAERMRPYVPGNKNDSAESAFCTKMLAEPVVCDASRPFGPSELLEALLHQNLSLCRGPPPLSYFP